MPDTQRFLYTLKASRPEMLTEGLTPEEEEKAGKHFAYLQKMAEQGVVLLAGRTLNTDASGFGIVILQAESEEAAREIMNNDPGVMLGLQLAELFPYRVALAAPNIERG